MQDTALDMGNYDTGIYKKYILGHSDDQNTFLMSIGVETEVGWERPWRRCSPVPLFTDEIVLER